MKERPALEGGFVATSRIFQRRSPRCSPEPRRGATLVAPGFLASPLAGGRRTKSPLASECRGLCLVQTAPTKKATEIAGARIRAWVARKNPCSSSSVADGRGRLKGRRSVIAERPPPIKVFDTNAARSRGGVGRILACGAVKVRSNPVERFSRAFDRYKAKPEVAHHESIGCGQPLC